MPLISQPHPFGFSSLHQLLIERRCISGRDLEISVDTERGGSKPAMDRILNMGPSPIKNSPQARFKEVVLGIRSNAHAKVTTPRAAMMHPPPQYPPPPQPPPTELPEPN